MFGTAKAAFQVISTCLSLVLNVFLIFMILKKSPPKMGNYRFLMIYFSCFAMVFSMLDIMAQPYVHSVGRCFVVIVEVGVFGEMGTLMILCALTGCFGGTIACFAIHFAYRFFALERRGRTKIFSGYYLPLWFILLTLSGVIWSILTYIFHGPNYQTSKYIEASIYEDYQLHLNQVTYIGALYFLKDNTPNIKQLSGSFILLLIMVISFLIVIYYGVGSFQLIRRLLKNEGESEYSRNLQKQLLKALIIQSCFPLFLMYIPVGIYVIFPMIGVNIQKFSRFITFIYALYPAIDPIPIIFIIDSYRFAFLKIFHLCQSQNRVREVNYATSYT